MLSKPLNPCCWFPAAARPTDSPEIHNINSYMTETLANALSQGACNNTHYKG